MMDNMAAHLFSFETLTLLWLHAESHMYNTFSVCMYINQENVNAAEKSYWYYDVYTINKRLFCGGKHAEGKWTLADSK